MIFKFVFLIILLNLRSVILETSAQENLFVVSTSESPCRSDEKFDQRLKQLESRIETCCSLNQTINHLQKVNEQILIKIKNDIKDELERTKKEIISLIANRNPPPKDCKDAKVKGHGTGVYRIRPELATEDFLVWCDMSTRGGGWTYLLNRFDGSQDFNKNWSDYKHGFGELSGEHWLGLEHLYYLTNSKRNELLVELVDWSSTVVYATYNNFKIAKESEGYKIASVGAYEGDAGDSLGLHKGYKFSTGDRDQDMSNNSNCAADFKGGWWYRNCYYCYLTGVYVINPIPGKKYDSAIVWRDFHGYNYSMKEARMMIRPIDL